MKVQDDRLEPQQHQNNNNIVINMKQRLANIHIEKSVTAVFREMKVYIGLCSRSLLIKLVFPSIYTTLEFIRNSPAPTKTY